MKILDLHFSIESIQSNESIIVQMYKSCDIFAYHCMNNMSLWTFQSQVGLKPLYLSQPTPNQKSPHFSTLSVVAL